MKRYFTHSGQVAAFGFGRAQLTPDLALRDLPDFRRLPPRAGGV